MDDWFEKKSAPYSPVRMLHGVMRKHPTDKYDCKAVSQSAYAAMRESMKTLHTNSVETAIVRKSAMRQNIVMTMNMYIHMIHER